MPVPKRKASKSRRNSRKSANQVVSASSFMDCKNCGSVVMPHQVCQNCGFYGGKKVMETKADRKVRRGTAASAKAAAVEPVATTVVEEPKVAAPKKTRAKKDSQE